MKPIARIALLGVCVALLLSMFVGRIAARTTKVVQITYDTTEDTTVQDSTIEDTAVEDVTTDEVTAWEEQVIGPRPKPQPKPKPQPSHKKHHLSACKQRKPNTMLDDTMLDDPMLDAAVTEATIDATHTTCAQIKTSRGKKTIVTITNNGNAQVNLPFDVSWGTFDDIFELEPRGRKIYNTDMGGHDFFISLQEAFWNPTPPPGQVNVHIKSSAK